MFVNPVGVEVVAAVKQVPIAGWYVAVVLPSREAFEPVRAMQRNLLGATLALSVLGGLLTWWMIRRQLAPMREAVRKLRSVDVAAGIPEPLPVRRDDEVGELITGFNRLLAALAEREAARAGSEQRFRDLVDTTDGIVWEADATSLPVTFVNGAQFGARAKANGEVEVYRNGTLIGVRDVSASVLASGGGYIGLFNFNAANTVLDNFGGGSVGTSPTPTPSGTPVPTATGTTSPTATNTPTATPTPSPTSTSTPVSFPSTVILDNFNRANGNIGSNWSGNTSGYQIHTSKLDVGTTTDIYWSASSFGLDQEAFVTRIDIAVIVHNADKDQEQVFFGATVTVADQDRRERTVSIVGTDEVDPERGRVSWISPIAKAVLKARVLTQMAAVVTPGWSVNLIVGAVGVIATLGYFHFTRPDSALPRGVARLGTWYLMVFFGATFGFTIMSRLSLLIGRTEFLMGPWLGILK